MKKQIEKVKPEIAKLRQEIINNGYSKEVSDSICDVMEGFGSYSFNLSHGASYAVIALQTAYLKANYPLEFYVAVLNSCESDNSKINKKVTAAQKFGLEVLPPHINGSQAKFHPVDGKILFGLGAISGIGESVVEKIIEERNANGMFTGIVNFMERCPELNTKQIVNLIKAGAFGQDKLTLLEKYLKYTVKQSYADKEYKPYKDVKTTPSLLILKTEYGIDTKDKDERIRLYNEARRKHHETVAYEEWKQERKKKMKKDFDDLWNKYAEEPDFFEFEALNLFLSDNPFNEVHSHIHRPFSAVEEGEECLLVGIIAKITKKKDKKGKTYVFCNIYGPDGIVEIVCFATTYAKNMDIIAKGQKVAVFAEKSGEDTAVGKNIETLDNWLRRRQITLSK